ncbi:MAG TPA: DNA polymerase Y family protein [Acidimicrobiales bacterium]|nr:DNA polymerase Y family protein [Acidimicrobiales bacterium]
MSATRTLVVWCPDWPVAAAGVGSAAPAAVFHANRVVACSAAARVEGVTRHQRRREAQGRCPDLIVIERDQARDARAFEPVVAVIEEMAVGVQVLRPGACAVATRGPSRYAGGDHALVRSVVDAVATVLPAGAACQGGIADGVFAAGMAARHGDGIVVPPGATPEFLAPFPVRTLDRPELADLLRRLGITTLGQFAALSAADVLGRFGPEGAAAHRLASGLDERPVSGRVPPLDLTVAVELDPPAERVDVAAFAARGMADELHTRLSSRGLSCTRVRIEAETEHGEALARVWRHDGPLTPGAMADRVRWQLDGWLAGTARTRPSGGLTLLRLVPEEVGPADGRQTGFWGSAAAVDERAARALARVQGMLGPDAVQTAVITGGRGPGEQVLLVPWGEPRPEPPEAERPWPGRVPAPAPASVHAAPPVAEVVDGDGRAVVVTGRCAVSAPPARVSIGGAPWADVTGWAGPWPVDERWWDPPAHRRRARFQVTTSAGPALLLTVEAGAWSVAATYD